VTLTPHPLLVPWSWKGRATPLLSLWAVRPLQSISASTRVHFPFLHVSSCPWLPKVALYFTGTYGTPVSLTDTLDGNVGEVAYEAGR